MVGGAKSVILVRISAPTAWPEPFRSPIVSVTRWRRSTGSSHQTGSGAIIAEIRVPSAPGPSSARTLTRAHERRPGLLYATAADRGHRAQLEVLGVAAAGPEVVAERAGDDGEDDVVDGSAV